MEDQDTPASPKVFYPDIPEWGFKQIFDIFCPLNLLAPVVPVNVSSQWTRKADVLEKCSRNHPSEEE